MAKRQKRETAAPAAPEPMGDYYPTQTPSVPQRVREAYSLTTLVEEVRALFPETLVTVADPNPGTRVKTSVTFVTKDQPGLIDVLELAGKDTRVERVETTDEWDITIHLRHSLRSMDSREPFGLDEFWSVVCDEYQIGSV